MEITWKENFGKYLTTKKGVSSLKVNIFNQRKLKEKVNIVKGLGLHQIEVPLNLPKNVTLPQKNTNINESVLCVFGICIHSAYVQLDFNCLELKARLCISLDIN